MWQPMCYKTCGCSTVSSLIQPMKQSKASEKPDTRVLWLRSALTLISLIPFGSHWPWKFDEEVPELFGSQAKFEYPPRVFFVIWFNVTNSWPQQRTGLPGSISGHGSHHSHLMLLLFLYYFREGRQIVGQKHLGIWNFVRLNVANS